MNASTAWQAREFYDRQNECRERRQLAALQLDRLRRSVVHAAAGNEHYRRAFHAAGVDPAELKSLDEFARYPFTVKDDLRRNYPFGWFAVNQSQVVRLHASSGTTGSPIVIGSTRADIDTWAELMARTLFCAGVRPGDVLHNSHGYGLFTGGLGVHYGAERLGCSVIPMSGGNTERQVQLLRDFGAGAIVGTPSYAVHIAEVAMQLGVDLVSGPLHTGVFGGEPWSEQMRSTLEQGFGVHAHDLYGLCEIMGPGVACECIVEDGLHGWEDHFLFEIIDPDSGAPLPPGETGELVITTLTREASPMIRYRTRDMTRLMTEPCLCGRSHVRIQKITGRSDDMLIIRGVNVYPSQIETALVGFPGLSPHYRLRVEREGAMDTLTLEVESAPGANFDTARSAARLTRRIKSRVGVTCTIRVIEPGQLPRSMGKAQRVQDLRKKP